MTILEHLDARTRLADSLELADETLRGFPGPLAATSTSRSTRFDDVRRVSRQGWTPPSELSRGDGIRSTGFGTYLMSTVALDPYTR